MKKLSSIITVLLLSTALICSAYASQNASKQECVEKCKEAAAFIQKNGIDAGIKAIGDKKGPFVWKDTYVFLMDLEGKMLAHPVKPQLTEGGSLLAKSDATGKKHFAEFIKVATASGKGWVDYMYSKPGMKAPKAKMSYIHRVEGTPYLVGAGVYN